MFDVFRNCEFARRVAFAATLLSVSVPAAMIAQTPAVQASSVRQLGTVKAIDGNNVTIITSAGAQVTVPIAPNATVLELPPGSTDLKTATPGAYANIAIGDRVVTGKPGDTDLASRVILMKSGAIAARNEEQQADWQRRGTGGLVKAIDGSTITISAGSRTISVETKPSTIFRRYAKDSVNFKDAQAGTLGDVHPGDQLSVRGDKSADGNSISAEEVVTGTFSNLSGAISAVDATGGTITLKDLTTKRVVTVAITANSDLRKLSTQAAAAFAARNNAAAGTATGAGSPSAPGVPSARPRNAGMDLSRMLVRLPTETIAELKPGDAVMIVASQGVGSQPFTAITLLSGVEQLLSAPAGAQPLTLSPWNIGGAPEGAGGQP